MQRLRFTYLLISVSVFTFGSLRAQTIRQRSTTEGLNLSLQGHVTGWSSDNLQYFDETQGSGPGVGLRIGYGLNQRYELFAQYDIGYMDAEKIFAQSFHFSNATAGLRFNFSATTHALRPYAELGFAYQTGKAQQVRYINAPNANILFKGGALHLGAGLQYFVALPIAISLNGNLQTGGKLPIYYNGNDTGDKADVTSFRLSVGVAVYLSELF